MVDHRAEAATLAELAKADATERDAAGYPYWAPADLAAVAQVHAALAVAGASRPTATTTEVDELATTHGVTAPTPEDLAAFVRDLGVEVI
ncbi:hypothetical protein CLV30_12827 [Haloactinopolyspora alba]|uniref:Uncharacterized protein n=1 Tax=Haloactinopolyspora alba TaxID=648780 RepID=A0A2P8DEX4_9ACTN|nr:hypothetical protein [Haloactinopolyspora alba]PSK95775.1 hypothetical protein CLV30_12827 [Haloactinopolyspora alba]